MSKVLILTEKPSQAMNFAKAFGGRSGTYMGDTFTIANAIGHLLTFDEPEDMVPEEYKQQFKSWSLSFIPWKDELLRWSKKPGISYDPRTKRKGSHAKNIKVIKDAAKGCDEIVIACDVDDSGEGDLLAREIIEAIGWKKKITRLTFYDEFNQKEVLSGYAKRSDVTNVANHGNYIKALARSKFDYLSMQLTRIATTLARTYGFQMVVRNGRLKSVVVAAIAEQLRKVRNYVKKAYFETKFKDENGHVYQRKLSEFDAEKCRFESVALCDHKKFRESDVVDDGFVKKATSPPRLLDFMSMSAILTKKGFSPEEILSTYQKMYDSQIVSYPRTGDKKITTEQYKQLLPLASKIAKVVGVDASLLTHTEIRKNHIDEKCTHGANRPGLRVPTSLSDLDKFGRSAKAIYTLIAKNYLALLAEDYLYNQHKGHVKDYPDFKTMFNVPVSMGYKAVFDSDKELKDDEDEENNIKPLGRRAKSFAFEGFNKKPPMPTMTWLRDFLDKYNVGTPSTKVSVVKELTTTKNAMLTLKKGVFGITNIGEVSDIMLQGSYIASVDVTEKLYNAMTQVGEGKAKPEQILAYANQLIVHDKEVFTKNATKLKTEMAGKKGMSNFEVKEKFEGVYAPTGEEVKFNQVWSGHTFTSVEVEELLSGNEISFDAVSKAGKPYKATGSLQKQEYNGAEFWGFAPEFKTAADYTIATAPFPKEWSGHTFTASEEAQLRDGLEIVVDCVSKRTGKPFQAHIRFGKDTYKGNESWKIIPNFS